MVVSEGLLIYLDEDEVTSLAADLHAQPHFSYWLVEVVSPLARDWMNWKWSDHLGAAKARFVFAPYDWRTFYRKCGWELVAFRNLSQTARKLNREPSIMRLFRFVGELYPRWGQMQAQLWESGVALLSRA